MRAPPFDREIVSEWCVQIAHHGAAARLRDLLWVAGDESAEATIGRTARARLDASVRCCHRVLPQWSSATALITAVRWAIL